MPLYLSFIAAATILFTSFPFTGRNTPATGPTSSAQMTVPAPKVPPIAQPAATKHASTVTRITANLIPGLQMDKIMIGDIMLMIPGLAMTNALRNMLVGNTISGTMRLAESLIWAAALAGGFMVALAIVDRIFGGGLPV